jgi:hypothetical protein
MLRDLLPQGNRFGAGFSDGGEFPLFCDFLQVSLAINHLSCRRRLHGRRDPRPSCTLPRASYIA